MKPWEVIGRARTADGNELTLLRHPDEFLIQTNGQNLMSSRMHGSEEALATLGCSRARTLAQPCVVVGGLGMGFTLRAALDILPPAAEVIVVEMVPEVVEWNRGPLGPLANHPLADPRVRIEINDVATTLRSNVARFDAVLLDVDNGSEALIAPGNSALYGADGIAAARGSLKWGGVLAVWSASDDRPFARRLHAQGFEVKRERVPARLKAGGGRHTILLAANGRP